MRALAGLSVWSGAGRGQKGSPAGLVSRRRGLPNAARDDLTVR